MSETDATDADDPDLGLGACPRGAFANVGANSVESATYYVATDGNDDNDGTSAQNAFASVQRGVDALAPGDTLSIAPGEYFGSVRRDGIGADGEVTTIRAQIPGTVLLRGDVPAPAFRPAAGYDFVWVADHNFAPDEEIQVVNERDTLQVLEEAPGIGELEFTPGRFYQDKEAGKIYISSSDLQPATRHHYSLSKTGTHGIYLANAAGVVIDGLTVTGFNANSNLDGSERTLRSVFGIFLAGASHSQIRRSHAYLNGRGIGTWGGDDTSGDNLIEHCIARGNRSHFGEAAADTGGITLINPRRTSVRYSQSFLNSDHGINIRAGNGESGADDMANQSFMSHSIAWGNGLSDLKIKIGAHIHQTDHFVALNPSVHYRLHPTHCTFVGRYSEDYDSDTIVLHDEPGDLDLDQEFADPDNFDFQLQGTSQFRGAAEDGSDRGAYPFEGNIFYVSPDGDDANDGLSVQNGWKTLAHAFDKLGAGHTLYVLPGTYQEDVVLSVQADAQHPVTIKGRGTGAAVIDGQVTINGSSHLGFERLNFAGPVIVNDSEAITMANSRLFGQTIALNATGTDGLRVTHSTFSGFEQAAIAAATSTDLFLANNLYDNAHGVAVHLDTADALTYADYNSYRSIARAWQIADGLCAADDADGRVDAHSEGHIPEFANTQGVPLLQNAEVFSAGGFDARPYGTYRDRIPKKEIELYRDLSVHSLSATTANLEWMTNFPTAAAIAWGESADALTTDHVETNRFASYSLTGLEPNTTYYVELKSLRIPAEVEIDAPALDLVGQTISFTTLPADEAPATYYVSPNGDDQHSGAAWDQAFASIQMAANVVNVGDTVMIGEGSYMERVRIRATGTESSPIVFRAAAGQQVIMDGAAQALNQAIVVGSKSYLSFDGLQFRDFSFAPNSVSGWSPELGSEFNLEQSTHITISRCISDGRRTASTARTIVARASPYLHMTNCVSTNKMSSAIYLYQSPHALFEHNVFMRPMIRAFHLRHSDHATLRKNIFTDSLRKKAVGNMPLILAGGSVDNLVFDENTIHLRSLWLPSERHIFAPGGTTSESPFATNTLFADPMYQGQLDLQAAGEGPYDFWPDRLSRADQRIYDFEMFMATNPQVTARGHGLQPAKFDNGLPN